MAKSIYDLLAEQRVPASLLKVKHTHQSMRYAYATGGASEQYFRPVARF